MKDLEYRKAYEDISPSEKLIQSTLLKLEKQKRTRRINLQTYFQIAFATCVCVVLGFGVSTFSSSNETPQVFVGSMFGEGSAWVLAVFLYLMMLIVILVIRKRRN